MKNPSRPNCSETLLCQDKQWLLTSEDNISLDEFTKILPPIRFYDIVNQDVKDAFQIVRKLMIHSYYEYSFFDVAVTKALHIFEMALKLRFRELNNKEWDNKKPLEKLIEWFRKRNFFEIEDKEFFDHVRNTRNRLSHPERHYLKALTSSHWIRTAVDLINDVYEDVELRKQRRMLKYQIRHDIDIFLKNGGKLVYRGIPVLIYACGDILVNNKVTPTIVYFTLFKILDADSEIKHPVMLRCEIAQLNFNASSFVVNILDGDELIFTRDLDVDEISKFHTFRVKDTADEDIIRQHNFNLHDSYSYVLGTWRYIRHLL